jgi:hypothetical protein
MKRLDITTLRHELSKLRGHIYPGYPYMIKYHNALILCSQACSKHIRQGIINGSIFHQANLMTAVTRREVRTHVLLIRQNQLCLWTLPEHHYLVLVRL